MLLLGTIFRRGWIHIRLVARSITQQLLDFHEILYRCSWYTEDKPHRLFILHQVAISCVFLSLDLLKSVQKRGDYSFLLCNKWECRAPAVRLSDAPINTSPVFSVATIITIIIRRNDTLFGRQQKVKSRGLAAHDVSMAPMCVQTVPRPPAVMSLGCSDLIWKSLASSVWSHQRRVAGKRWKFSCDAFAVAGCRWRCHYLQRFGSSHVDGLMCEIRRLCDRGVHGDEGSKCNLSVQTNTDASISIDLSCFSAGIFVCDLVNGGRCNLSHVKTHVIIFIYEILCLTELGQSLKIENKNVSRPLRET